MHITIAGKLGSGKSTICRALQQEHGFEIYSTGAVQREVAKEMGISTLELNQRMLTDPALDHVIDDAVAKLSRERREDAIIFDSRMAWHFAERSFKIFVTVDPLIAAQRVMLDPRGSEETYESVEDARDKLIERSRVENARFRDIYHVDNLDYHNYDLILDTSYASREEESRAVLEAFHAYLAQPWEGTRVIICPRSLTPTCLPGEEEAGTVTVASDGVRHYLVTGHETWAQALRDGDCYLTAELTDELPPRTEEELAACAEAWRR